MQVDQIMKSHESKHNPYIWKPGHAHVDDKQMHKLLGLLWEAFGVIDKLDGIREKGWKAGKHGEKHLGVIDKLDDH